MLSYRILTACILVVGATGVASSYAQQGLPAGAKLFRIPSSHTSFPEPGRSGGYRYDSQYYSAPAHYSDSSVLILVPSGLKSYGKTDLVFWFHGWHNNIDTTLSYYHLATQFMTAHCNAVMVLAETAKDAPDSYGGKLEQPGVFAKLVEDVLNRLKTDKLIPKKATAGTIILGGHSGAYRVIAGILQNGGIAVQEVYLFDALYSRVDTFSNWLQQNSSRHFINWYTNHGGGTDEVSLEMMEKLKKENTPFISVEETAISATVLHTNRVVFVHSLREHNDIIFNPDNVKLLLENASSLSAIKP